MKGDESKTRKVDGILPMGSESGEVGAELQRNEGKYHLLIFFIGR